MRLANQFALLYLIAAGDLEPSFAEKLRGARALQGNKYKNKPISSCYTTNVVEVQYEDPSIEESRIECGTDDGQSYNVDLPADVVKANKAGVANGKLVIDLPAGSAIEGNKIKLPPGAKAGLKPGKSNAPPFQRHGRDLAALGTRTVLVVRIIAQDGATSASQSALSDSVFSNNADGNGADAVSLKSQYNACSGGAFQFNEAADRGGADGIINGSTTVTVTTSTSEGDRTMRNAASAALNDKFGVTSPNQLADHVMYCLPANTMSGIAYASVNGWYSVYSNNWCTYVSGQMHELGHNIGLAHSNEAGTYKDQTGMMGYSYGQNDSPRMCFNGAKSWQLRWYEDNHATYGASSGLQTYRLIGQANYDQAGSNTVILKLNTGTSTDYYVSFNRKTGNNSGTQEGGNQVTIQRMGGEGNSYSESELLSKLSQGGTWTLPDFEGQGELRLTVNTINTSSTPGYADITVSVGSTTPPPTPSPTTASPTNEPTPSPTPSPTTASPTNEPTTASPTNEPTPSPTPSPTTAGPTNFPTPFPTPSPTEACLRRKQGCSSNDQCCSNRCKNNGSCH